jgi:hypothetical protein
VICLRALQGISLGGTTVFSQSLNWDLTADVTGGPWKGTKNKKEATQGRLGFPGPQKEASFASGPSREFSLPHRISFGEYTQV